MGTVADLELRMEKSAFPDTTHSLVREQQVAEVQYHRPKDTKDNTCEIEISAGVLTKWKSTLG